MTTAIFRAFESFDLYLFQNDVDATYDEHFGFEKMEYFSNSFQAYRSPSPKNMQPLMARRHPHKLKEINSLALLTLEIAFLSGIVIALVQ